MTVRHLADGFAVAGSCCCSGYQGGRRRCGCPCVSIPSHSQDFRPRCLAMREVPRAGLRQRLRRTAGQCRLRMSQCILTASMHAPIKLKDPARLYNKSTLPPSCLEEGRAGGCTRRQPTSHEVPAAMDASLAASALHYLTDSQLNCTQMRKPCF